jgi:hypothetical protein
MEAEVKAAPLPHTPPVKAGVEAACDVTYYDIMHT